jgi:hypothetical protein
MTFRNGLWASLGLCAALGTASAWAQSEPLMAAPPAPQNYSGIEVVNGGVDLDVADAIERIQSRYRLALEISGRGGDYYVADNLKVKRGGDVVADIPEAGPWLLMDLPPGRYTLVGDFGGTEVKRDVVVGNRSTKVSWVLPSSID